MRLSQGVTMNDRITYPSRRDIVRACSAGSLSAVFPTPLIRKANAAPMDEITTSSDQWRRGGRLRHQIGERAISSEGMAWRSDSNRLAWRASGGVGFVFDLPTERVVTKLPLTRWLKAAHYVRGTNTLLLGGALLTDPERSPAALTVVEGETGQVLRQIIGPVPPDLKLDPAAPNQFALLSPVANSAEFIETDRETGLVVAGTQAGLAGLFLLNPSTWQTSVEAFSDKRVSGALSRSGRQGTPEFALSSGSGHVLIANRRTRTITHDIYAHPADVSCVAYSPDGSVLLSAMSSAGNGRNDQRPFDFKEAERHKIRAWRTTDYTKVGELDTEMGSCDALSFHPDGMIFASASVEEVVLFDTRTLAVIRRMSSPVRLAKSIAFSPNGRWLAESGAGAGGRVALFEA